MARNDDRLLPAIADALVDGAPIDWDTAAAGADGDAQRRLIAHLETVARVTARARDPVTTKNTQAADAPHAAPLTRAVALGTWLIVACAGLKIAGGLIGFSFGAAPALDTTPIPAFVYALQVFVFGLSGAALVIAGRKDRRAVFLGAFFLLIASTFADRLMLRLGPAAQALGLIPADAFLPVFLWQFVRDFPQGATLAIDDRIARRFVRLSFLIAAVLAAPNLMRLGGAASAGVIALFDRHQRVAGHYWSVVLLLCLAALPVLLWKTQRAAGDERRRARFFLWGLGIGLLPMLIAVVLGSPWSPVAAWIEEPDVRMAGAAVIYPALLSIPISTAYAVLVQRLLDVRVVARKMLEYGLARFTLLLVAAVPLVSLAWYAYDHRTERVVDLFSGVRPAMLAALGCGALVVLRARQRLLRTIDRRFFREQVEAGEISARLTERSRLARSVRELTAQLAGEIEEAFHLRFVAMLVASGDPGRLISLEGKTPPLDCAGALCTLIAADTDPIDVDHDNPRSVFALLPRADREWLAERDVRLVVPLIASDGRLLGMLALGRKRSELPFSRQDRQVLRTAAAAAALALENWTHHRKTDPDSDTARLTREDDPEGAAECVTCGTVHPPRVEACSCGGPLVAAPLPRVVAGKYHVERRAGKGGMSIVYRAVDVTLDRVVAIKALPAVSADYAERLRREARVMAAVTHPNLAMVYGVETWRGAPLLIVEYLPGGTLADRLARGPLAPREVLDLGVLLSRVLEYTHGAGTGILHRDIKPSNIAYTAAGAPKLLDFGLAGTVPTAVREDADRSGAPSDAEATGEARDLAIAPDQVSGTILYLPPEAFDGASPDPCFDLWSTSVVLFEALTGVNPFRARTLQESCARIRRGKRPSLSSLGCAAPAFETFFDAGLAVDRARRPATATQLRERLTKVSMEPG